MYFLFDLLLLGIAYIIWPPEKPVRRKEGEWVVLGDLHGDRDRQEEDPFLNEDFNDGPDW